MKYKFLFVFILLIFSKLNAQYYYQDIIGTRQTNQQYKLLRAFQYKQVSAKSYADNELSKDFILEQSIAKDGKKITTRSASAGNTESFFISYYQNNKVMQTTDSGINAITTVEYEYDNTGKMLSVNTNSRDFDGTFTNNEKHIWGYNEKGLPEKMLKIKNLSDSTLITFTYDQDNVAEEKWIKNNHTVETWYYYYNPKNQLTDIVRFNRKAKAMIPDFLFEYDNHSHLTQMTQIQNGSANYLIWKYTYNENGMKQKEVVYNKQKELLGSIEYAYM